MVGQKRLVILRVAFYCVVIGPGEQVT